MDSLGYHYPEVAAERNPHNELSPWHIRPNDGRHVEWICPGNPTHRWSATPVSRVSGSTCPECQVTGSLTSS
ncbi:zinc-ribbon domain-containing protein [Gordonia zhenghanii]|uniref:zinc-ribbon domain-containing protein n=1 Tax=Gordonia zhenghanii TaxID=2911516 RepID=UPI0035571C79